MTLVLALALLALAALAWRTRRSATRAETAARDAATAVTRLDRALAEALRRLQDTGAIPADATRYLPRVHPEQVRR